MDFLKTLVKKNIITSILFDYIMSISGFNFEKEYKIVNLIKKKLPIVVDIGANRGESIKNFLNLRKNLKIYSFEPKKKSFEFIKRKYKNKNIKVFNFGIGNTQKKIDLYTPKIYNYEFSGLSSTNFVNLNFRLNFFFKKIKHNFKFIKEIIQIKKLDKLNLKADLIKIDAEGSELDIVKSSIKTIIKYKPLLIIEYNHINFFKIKKILSKIGYKDYILRNNNFFRIDKRTINKIKKKTSLTNIIYANNFLPKFI